MRSIKSLLLIAVITVCSIQSASAIRFGVTVGGNMNAPLSLSDFQNMPSSYDGVAKYGSQRFSGFRVGPTMDLGLPLLPLHISLGAVYSQQSIETNFEGLSSIKTHSIEVPLDVKLRLGIPKIVHAFVAAGIGAGFTVGDNFDQIKNDVASLDMDKVQWKGRLGVGAELFEKIQVDFFWQIPFNKDKINAKNPDDLNNIKAIDFKSKSFVLSASYYF